MNREPTDQEVHDFAAEHDCSMLEARETLRAELLTPADQDVNYRDFESLPEHG